ncbi:DNA damage-inducible protein 1 [Geranomyces variabilis]|uniref:DNA damage-inducible protein 1 n=1 Tax=Geranomyces variabilis TaxID=109894 RepID=A0AAD5TII4_9FUNG|nr:DNA damage-inducible protein 1 [Geranomyces variabilis]
MRLHLSDEDGQIHSLDVDGNMELENLGALIEVEMSIPSNLQHVMHNGNELTDMKKTISAVGIQQDDMLLVRRRAPPRQSAPGAAARPGVGRQAGQVPTSAMAETIRQQILADPHMLRNLSSNNPELAQAAMNDPAAFQRMFIELENKRRDIEEQQRQAEEALANADPFDVEAQKRIEEAIRQQNISQNMENAMEYHPESFGRVVMLYIDVEVNGHHVKAFVDSGAQATIMSPELAEKCNIMHLLDVRFAGVAMGVGTAKILGRIHSAQMKLGTQWLPCSLTVMEGKDVDLLFGLDMLKRHQAVIDLEKNVLRIHGDEIRFLSEHELPPKARWGGEEAASPQASGSAAPGAAQPPAGSSSPSRATPNPAAAAAPAPTNNTSAPGGPPSSRPAAAQAAPLPPRAAASSSPQHSEDKIKSVVDLGFSREQAIGALDASGGNVEVAASFLFQ